MTEDIWTVCITERCDSVYASVELFKTKKAAIKYLNETILEAARDYHDDLTLEDIEEALDPYVEIKYSSELRVQGDTRPLTRTPILVIKQQYRADINVAEAIQKEFCSDEYIFKWEIDLQEILSDSDSESEEDEE